MLWVTPQFNRSCFCTYPPPPTCNYTPPAFVGSFNPGAVLCSESSAAAVVLLLCCADTDPCVGSIWAQTWRSSTAAQCTMTTAVRPFLCCHTQPWCWCRARRCLCSSSGHRRSAWWGVSSRGTAPLLCSHTGVWLRKGPCKMLTSIADWINLINGSYLCFYIRKKQHSTYFTPQKCVCHEVHYSSIL